MTMNALQTRQKEFAQYFIAGCPRLGIPGLHAVSASALVGNSTIENQVLPTTVGVKDHGSDGSLQWRLERLTDMKNWCVANFGRWDNLEAQAAFTVYECRRDYPSLWADLEEAGKSIETLTANVCDVYLRPAKATENLDGRIAAANATRLLCLMPHISPVSSAPTTTTPTVVRNTGSVGAAAAATAAVVAGSNGAPYWLVLCLVGITVLSILVVLYDQTKLQGKPTVATATPAPGLPPTPTVFPTPTPQPIPPGRPPEPTPNPTQPNPTPIVPAPGSVPPINKPKAGTPT